MLITEWYEIVNKNGHFTVGTTTETKQQIQTKYYFLGNARSLFEQPMDKKLKKLLTKKCLQ